MDKKSKSITLIILLTVIFLALSATYYRFFVARNYDIYTQVSCDPQSESCYKVTGCPQDMTGCDIPETTYYKILRIKALDVAYCNHNVESCSEPVCTVGNDCEYIQCDPSVQAGALICGDDADQ